MIQPVPIGSVSPMTMMIDWVPFMMCPGRHLKYLKSSTGLGVLSCWSRLDWLKIFPNKFRGTRFPTSSCVKLLVRSLIALGLPPHTYSRFNRTILRFFGALSSWRLTQELGLRNRVWSHVPLPTRASRSLIFA